MTSLGPYLDKLYTLKTLGKRTLDGLRHIEKLLGSPSQSFSSVHVAGTNGKGSVTTKVAKGCTMAGKKTGLFTSPHISCFRERIAINEEPIPEDAAAALLDRIFSLIEKEGVSLSFFEITTLMALLYFSQANVDIAIIETGIGGRFDATNIITPQLSVITSIALDHTEILGATIEAIASEKAGIIKQGVPVIIGPTVPRGIIEPVALEKNSPLIQVSGIFNSFQDENSAVAKASMEQLHLPEPAISEGLKATPPCRMEWRIAGNVSVVLDVAHNQEGLTRLFNAIKEQHPQFHLRVVVGLSKSKDIEACCATLRDFGSHFYPVEAPNGWGIPVSHLIKELHPATLSSNVTAAIRQAINDADSPSELVVVCGSFYIMDEARRAT